MPVISRDPKLAGIQHRMLSEISKIMRKQGEVDQCSKRQVFMSIALDVYAALYPSSSKEDVHTLARTEWLSFKKRKNTQLPLAVYDRCIGILSGKDPLPPLVMGEVEARPADLKGVEAQQSRKR